MQLSDRKLFHQYLGIKKVEKLIYITSYSLARQLNYYNGIELVSQLLHLYSVDNAEMQQLNVEHADSKR